MVIHAKKFVGQVESLGGPDATEEYEPLCGVDGDDLSMTSDRDWKDEGTTCKLCLAILGRNR